MHVCTGASRAGSGRELQVLTSMQRPGGGCRKWDSDPLALEGWMSYCLSPHLLLQGSGGTAGAPGERGRTGPLGRKVCRDKGNACFWRPSRPSPNTLSRLPHLSVCPAAWCAHPSPLWSLPPAAPADSGWAGGSPSPPRGCAWALSSGLVCIRVARTPATTGLPHLSPGL